MPKLLRNSLTICLNISFFMFSKDNTVNLASVLGYHAEVQFVNNSSKKAEMFSVGVDTFDSSK